MREIVVEEGARRSVDLITPRGAPMKTQLELAGQDIFDLIVHQIEPMVALQAEAYFLENLSDRDVVRMV